MPIKTRLREKDISKLSSILQYPEEVVQKLNSMSLIDSMEARNILILEDWRKLKRSKKYTTTQIISALMNEHQVSKSKIENIIYAKRKIQYWCEKCEKQITKGEHLRNKGVCDVCVSKSIEL